MPGVLREGLAGGSCGKMQPSPHSLPTLYIGSDIVQVQSTALSSTTRGRYSNLVQRRADVIQPADEAATEKGRPSSHSHSGERKRDLRVFFGIVVIICHHHLYHRSVRN